MKFREYIFQNIGVYYHLRDSRLPSDQEPKRQKAMAHCLLTAYLLHDLCQSFPTLNDELVDPMLNDFRLYTNGILLARELGITLKPKNIAYIFPKYIEDLGKITFKTSLEDVIKRFHEEAIRKNNEFISRTLTVFAGTVNIKLVSSPLTPYYSGPGVAGAGASSGDSFGINEVHFQDGTTLKDHLGILANYIRALQGKGDRVAALLAPAKLFYSLMSKACLSPVFGRDTPWERFLPLCEVIDVLYIIMDDDYNIVPISGGPLVVLEQEEVTKKMLPHLKKALSEINRLIENSEPDSEDDNQRRVFFVTHLNEIKSYVASEESRLKSASAPKPPSM